MKKMLTLIAVTCIIGCADPAFQQYIQNRQATIAAMPNGAEKYIAQERLDQQILADKQRQNQQAANAAAAIAGGIAAGAAAYNASQPHYYPVVYPVYPPVVYPVYRPWYGY
jgi:hypothetical protein